MKIYTLVIQNENIIDDVKTFDSSEKANKAFEEYMGLTYDEYNKFYELKDIENYEEELTDEHKQSISEMYNILLLKNIGEGCGSLTEIWNRDFDYTIGTNIFESELL